MLILNILLTALGIYFGLGILFGLYFVIAGAVKLDPAIRESKFVVRLLLLPGAIGLWAILLKRLLQNKQPT